MTEEQVADVAFWRLAAKRYEERAIEALYPTSGAFVGVAMGVCHYVNRASIVYKDRLRRHVQLLAISPNNAGGFWWDLDLSDERATACALLAAMIEAGDL